MPQFVLIAHDAADENALSRRMAARAGHLAAISQYRDSGNILCGLALTDKEGKMNGSVIVTNFPDRAAFDAWLAEEPFKIHQVWKDIMVLDAALAPTFVHLLENKG